MSNDKIYHVWGILMSRCERRIDGLRKRIGDREGSVSYGDFGEYMNSRYDAVPKVEGDSLFYWSLCERAHRRYVPQWAKDQDVRHWIARNKPRQP